ncbi:MAG: MATE family efflux transporter [Verrucomicrobiota bacterium]|nr:MATE family efflux transporter [Verrucomicrobiota bacterium]
MASLNPLRLNQQDWSDLRIMLVSAFPLIVLNFTQTGMQFTDAWMVSKLGSEALAAVMPSGMMFLIPLSFGWGLMQSLNTFVAQCIGRGEPQGAGHYTLHGLLIGLLFGLAMIALWPLTPAIFRLVGHEPAVQAMEVQFFQTSLLGAFAGLTIAALSSFFTGMQRTKILLVGALLGTALNIFFNWLFIYGNWGCPRLGLTGSALGTVLAQVCQMIFLLCFFWNKHNRAAYGTLRWRYEGKAILQIFKVGAPAGAQFTFDLFTWGVIILWMIGQFGTAHLAANTIAVRYLHLAFMPALALAAILTARVGQAIGEKNPARAESQTRIAFTVIMVYMMSIGLLFFFGRTPLMHLFTQDPEIIHAGGLILIVTAIYQLFDAMYITYSHSLRGAGDTIWPAVMLIIYSLVVLVGGGLTIIHYFPEWKSVGPWLATTLYVVALGVTYKIRWHKGKWRKMDIFKA